MVLFNNIPYKRMCLKSKVNLTKRFSKRYKRMCLTTRLYGTVNPQSYMGVTFMNQPNIPTPQVKPSWFGGSRARAPYC